LERRPAGRRAARWAAARAGLAVDGIFYWMKIGRWLQTQMKEVVEFEKELAGRGTWCCNLPNDMNATQEGSERRYRRGAIASWQYSSVYGYHGYIRPDQPYPDGRMILVNTHSLRNPGAQVKAGDPVLFATQKTPRGDLATDVYIVFGDSPEAAEVEGRAVGTVRDLHFDRGFGILELEDGRTAMFHFSDLEDPSKPPYQGGLVSARLFERQTLNRFTGQREARLGAAELRTCHVEKPTEFTAHPDVALHQQAQGLLAKALLAREEGRLDDAAQIYEQGLNSCPASVVFLSYAAMEKADRHDPEKALGILERGIKRYPKNPKLHEDAGLLAASTKQSTKALQLLEKALQLSREPGQGGEKGVLLALARTSYRLGDASSLQKAVFYFETAERAFGERGLPSQRDVLALNLARLRTQQQRGALAARFFEDAGFHIVRAETQKGSTVSGDIVVKASGVEFTESYGLSSLLLVRCMFQAEVGMPELRNLDNKLRTCRESQIADSEVALLVVESLTPDIERILYSRIANRREHLPAIVPISQEEMEGSPDKVGALRSALDKWLFKRDLFAVNAPVFGARFFGRINPIAEIRDAISASKPIGIFGLRKVGKTSILHEIERRSLESGDIVLYMDLLALPEDVTDTRWLYWDLGTQLRAKSQHLVDANFQWRLGGVFADYLAIPADFPVATAFDSDLKRVLSVIENATITPRPKVVLMLDEIERLLPTRLGEPGFRGFFGFFSYFRGVSQQTEDFTMIVTAANPGIQEAAQFEGRDNPVFNYFKEVYLKFFEAAECEQMITQLGRGMGIGFEGCACELVYSLTGGHPFIARRLCSFLAEKYSDRPLRLTDNMMMAAMDDYLDLRADADFNEIFERLSRDYPEEREVCLELAREDGPVSITGLTDKRKGIRPLLRHLIGYQLARADASQVTLSMELMRRWLRRNYLSDDAMPAA
jgi:tetratricopeptide (TPR) repeat protein